MPFTRVNRIAADGTTVTVTIGKHVIPLLEISYGDSVESEDMSEMGVQEISASTPGQYKTDEITAKMAYDTWSSKFMPLAQKDGFGNERFQMVVSHSHPDLGSDSDLLDPCRYMGSKAAKQNSASPAVMEIKFKTQQVYWTDARKTLNQRDLSKPLAPSNF